jgi:hypothetical protein
VARRGSAIEVELTDDALVLRYRGRSLTIRDAAVEDDEEDADFLVRLDDIEFWNAPDGETAIEIEELQKILEAIEDFAEKNGLDIAFE